MNPLSTLLEIHDPETVAQDLAVALDKKITAPMVVHWSKQDRVPKTWAAALGLPDGGEAATSAASAAGGGDSPAAGAPLTDGGRQTELPPRKPADAQTAPTGLQLTQQAKERIAALHVFVGASVATATDADGFENDKGVGGGIAKLWTDKSDPIADAWIEWAQEGNKFAQSFVRLMSTGGAGGNLALGYAALLGGTAYIMGHMPDNEATRVVYGRYSKYRTVVPEPQPVPRGRGSGGAGAGNGASADAGAADSVGDAAGSPRA